MNRKHRIELGWSPQVLPCFTCNGGVILLDLTRICSQEIIGEIGPPISVFRKSEDPNDG